MNGSLIRQKLADWRLAFDEAVYGHEKRSLIVLGLFVVSAVIFSAAMPYAQERIRESQLEGVVYPIVADDHFKTMPYAQADSTIKQTKALSVMFSQPRGDSFAKVVATISDQKTGSELNRQFYFYPLVYDVKEIAAKYKLDPAKVTFIFFENGVEKNRVVTEELANFKEEFVPELNRLPMWNIKTIDKTEEEAS